MFLDSLDEASIGDDDDLTYWLQQVASTVHWPIRDVRWVISTRPALLTPKVLSDLRRLFGRERTVVPSSDSGSDVSPTDAALNAAFSEKVTDPELLAVFSMTELEKGQAIKYLSKRLGITRAPEVVALASRRGLASLTGNPGGLAMLAEIDLLNRPPDSLTDIFERLETSIWRKLAGDRRIKEAGNEGADVVAQTMRRLAAASQLTQLPNIELPQDGLLLAPDAISARLIAGSRMSEGVLQTLLGAHGFIDVGHHQVKLFPDELPPYLAARHLSALVNSPEMAHRLLAALSWQAPTGERGVDRRLLPFMGWLATLNPHCRAEILGIDPHAIAFFGDLRNPTVTLTDAERALRESFEAMVARDDWPGRGQFRLTSENYWQAGSARTASVISELFGKHGSRTHTRSVLLKIAAQAGSAALRDVVMTEHEWAYEKLLKSSTDAHYILELGRDDDLRGLAYVLRHPNGISESFAASMVATLGWKYLMPKDVVSILAKYFARGHGGFHLTLEVEQSLLPDASDEQLLRLVRGLVLKVSATHASPGARPTRVRVASQRFIEFTAELLSILLRRGQSANASDMARLCLILFRVLRDAQHGPADVDELKDALKQQADVRQAYLLQLVEWVSNKKEDLWHFVYGYASLCSPTDEDVEKLQLAALTRLFREERAKAERMGKDAPRQQRKQRKQFKLSGEAIADLRTSAESIREGTALNMLAWLANWLLQTSQGARYGEVDFKQFEDQAGNDLADAVRAGLSRLWRTEPPRFNEEQPNSTFHITAAGLQGLHLELGDGKELPALTSQEVRQAIRYAPFEINGFPNWFWALVSAHEEDAAAELESLASRADAGAVSRDHAEKLFSSLTEAPQLVRERLAPMAWQALETKSPEHRDFVVDKMLRVTASVPELASQTDFEALAWRRVSEPFASADVASTTEEVMRRANAIGQAPVWASHWLERFPRGFVERMQHWVSDDSKTATTFLLALASELGRERGQLLSRIATSTPDGVDSLGALYVLMLQVVNPKEDSRRASEEEVYAIGARESAEDFRDALAPAITDARTQRAYDVLEWLKLKLGSERRAYFTRLQYDMREAQFCPPPLDQQNFERFERTFEAGITGRVTFDLAVQNALASVKYDIEQGEHSLRRFFSAIALNAVKTDTAGLALESDFQQLLASELKHHARGQFTVQREPETAEHNRRDVHCAKESLDLTASIELKMSERWTLLDYFEALERQLVGQYMRQRNANTGFLVIVLQRERTWKCSETGKSMSFDELIGALQSRADALMRDDSSKYLKVVGINAIPPQNFRLTRATRVRASTERATSPKPTRGKAVRKPREIQNERKIQGRRNSA
ncbi:MAG: hypothetical protein JSS56_03805 [Proteobacteria bacterium]|nr:hypothetical protein [Pseudomonadota bacterium]